jgi:hypothetical protein
MKRNPIAKPMIVATALALAPLAASADDSSMSALTGDSYAYFNRLEFRLGQFNRSDARTMVAGDPAEPSATTQGRTRFPVLLAGPMPSRTSIPKDAMNQSSQAAMPGLRDDAASTKGVRVLSPFRDDTGQ